MKQLVAFRLMVGSCSAVITIKHFFASADHTIYRYLRVSKFIQSYKDKDSQDDLCIRL